MTSPDLPLLFVRSPADLLAAVPYLLGFHPTDSVVVVALRGKRVVFVARADLAGTESRPEANGPTTVDQTTVDPPPGADEIAAYIAEIVARQQVESTVAIGYGPAEQVTPAVDATRAALELAGLRVLDALRVTDGRYWSYLCVDPGCCPMEGKAYDPTSSQVAAEATFAGKVALPDRAALTSQVAPLGGPVRESMRRATRRAEERAVRLLDSAPSADLLGGRALRSAGASAIRTAMDRHRQGGRLTDDEVAWLSVLLTHVPVRDHAWERTDGFEWQQALWTEVTRRVEPGLVAAPASLLAFAAWRAGHGALAAVAVERALRDQPDYSLALLLDEMLRNGVQPSTLDGWPKVGSGRRRDRTTRRRSRRDTRGRARRRTNTRPGALA